MKYFIVCASLVLGAICIQGKPLNKQQKDLLASYRKECVVQSGVNLDVVEKTKEGVFANDPLLKEYQFCFSQKLGFQNSDGKINQDVFTAKLKKLASHDEELLAKLVKCGVESSSPQETAYQVAQCMYNASPSHVQLYLFSPGVVHLSPEKSERLLKFHKECANETQVDEEFIKNAHRKGEYVDDMKFKDFLFCFAKKIGFQNENGDVQKDAFKKSAKDIISDEVLVEKICNKCFVQKDSPQDTAFFVFKCVSETSPVRVDFFPNDGKRCGFRKIVKKCIKDSDVDVSLIRLAKQGQFTNDRQLKEYYFCIAQKVGTIGENGEVNSEVVKEKTTQLFKDPAVAEELFKKCLIQQDTPVETVFQSVQCYYNNSPGHVDLFQTGPLPEDIKRNVDANIKFCLEKNPVSQEILEKSRKGDFVEDMQLKKYLYCLNRKSDIQFEDERIKKDVFRKHLNEILSEKETDAIIEKCAKNKETPENTAFELFKCVYAYAPDSVVVF